MSISTEPRIWTRVAAFIAIAFGLLTVKEGSSVLVGDVNAIAAAGAFVPFVVWFNTIAGVAYVVAGIGLWMHFRWSAGLAFAIAASSLGILAALFVHIMQGGEFELRTVFAMSLRAGIWIAFSAIAYKHIWKSQSCEPAGDSRPNPTATRGRP
jgi:hypothetical protein